MGRMKDHLIECQQLLTQGRYAALLRELLPWGDKAPAELWAVIAWLALQEGQTREYLHFMGKPCPNHGGSFDCTPFCELCEGNQELPRGAN